MITEKEISDQLAPIAVVALAIMDSTENESRDLTDREVDDYIKLSLRISAVIVGELTSRKLLLPQDGDKIFADR